MDFFAKYQSKTKLTDQFLTRPEYDSVERTKLYCLGMFGEAGSVLAEFKKHKRDEKSLNKSLLEEELGDTMWYFARLCDEHGQKLQEIHATISAKNAEDFESQFVLAIGDLTSCVISATPDEPKAILSPAFCKVHSNLAGIAGKADLTLQQICSRNLLKTYDRWPTEDKQFSPLLDKDFETNFQLPRKGTFEITHNNGTVQIYHDGSKIGADITDNTSDEDWYRFHDVFHIAYMVFLGWTPVFRGLLGRKRRCDVKIDRNEDGGRARAIEEGISALVFNHAKQHNFYEHTQTIDGDLLSVIKTMISAHEVKEVPVWQWEKAILEGFKLFRQVKANEGGIILYKIGDERYTKFSAK